MQVTDPLGKKHVVLNRIWGFSSEAELHGSCTESDHTSLSPLILIKLSEYEKMNVRRRGCAQAASAVLAWNPSQVDPDAAALRRVGIFSGKCSIMGLQKGGHGRSIVRYGATR